VALYIRLRAIPITEMNMQKREKSANTEYPKKIIKIKNKFNDTSKIAVFFLFFH
jgi:hypothetical protein